MMLLSSTKGPKTAKLKELLFCAPKKLAGSRQFFADLKNKTNDLKNYFADS